MSASVLALDCGKMADHAAIALAVADGPDVRVPLLERVPLGTRYAWTVGHLTALLTRHAALRPVLLLDRGGVGVAVQELCESAGLHPIGIQSTGGRLVHPHPWGLSVPKRLLVGALLRLTRTGRLRVEVDDRDVRAALAGELQSFTMTLDSQTGHDRYGARTAAAHDDLLSCLSVSAWYLLERARYMGTHGKVVERKRSSESSDQYGGRRPRTLYSPRVRSHLPPSLGAK